MSASESATGWLDRISVVLGLLQFASSFGSPFADRYIRDDELLVSKERGIPTPIMGLDDHEKCWAI